MATMMFPRGSLVRDEEAPSKEDPPPKDDVLFGRVRSSKKTESTSKKRKAVEDDGDAISVVRRTLTVAAKHSKKTVARAVRFSGYHDEMLTLGVVRSASERHAVISLPGALAGHADLQQGNLKVSPGDVVACAVLGRRYRNDGKSDNKKRGAKRIDLSLAPKTVNVGLRLEDLATPGTIVFGRVASDEGRGFVIDLGVNGATGFLSKKRGETNVNKVRFFSVQKANLDSGVVDLSLETDNVNGDDKKIAFSALKPGLLVQCRSVQRLSDGASIVSFLSGEQFAGLVDADHSPPNDDDAKDQKSFQARVLLVDRAAKVLRLSRLPHLVDLGKLHNCCKPREDENDSALLPMIGALLEELRLERFDAKVGAWWLCNEKTRVFVHVSKLPEGLAASLTKNDTSMLPFARVIGCAPLEGWAIASSLPEAIDPATPITMKDARPGRVFRKREVLAVGTWGVKVKLSETLSAVATNAHVSDAPVAKIDPRKRLRVGNFVDCRVLRTGGWLDKSKKNTIQVTLKKRFIEDDHLDVLDSYQKAFDIPGATYRGLVTAADRSRGLVVTFFDGVHGRVPPASVESRKEDLGPGDVVDCVVRRCSLRSGGDKPRLVLALNDDTLFNLTGLEKDLKEAFTSKTQKEKIRNRQEPVEVATIFSKAAILEILDNSKNDDDPSSTTKSSTKKSSTKREVSALVRVVMGNNESFVARMSVADVADDGTNGEILLRRFARTRAVFPVVVVEAPARGALARVAAKPFFIAAPDLLEAAASVGNVLAGSVAASKPYGSIVRFFGSAAHHKGLIPKALLVSDAFVDDASRGYFSPGDAVRCVIDRIDDDEDEEMKNKKESRVVLRTTRLPTDKRDFRALAAVFAGLEQWLANSSDDEKKPPLLGRTVDAKVVRVKSDGSLSLSVEKENIVVPADQALACNEGDVVKARLLSFGECEILATLKPSLVRAGRKKRRAEIALDVGSEVQGQVLAPNDAFAMVITDTGALGLIAIADYHRRGSLAVAKRKSSVTEARAFRVSHATVNDLKRQFSAETAKRSTPFDDLPVFDLINDDDEEEDVTSSSRPPKKLRSSSEKARQPLSSSSLLSDNVVGSAIDCRVLEVVNDTYVKLGVRVDDSDNNRATAILDASDYFATKEDQESGDMGPLFRGLAIADIVRCVVLGVSEDTKAATTKKPKKIQLTVGRGGDRVLTRLRPTTWREAAEATHLDAVVLKDTSNDVVKGTTTSVMTAAVAPEIRGRVSLLDVVNAANERQAFSPDNVDEAAQEALAKATAPGKRMVLSVLDAEARTLTPWVDSKGQPRSLKPGDVVVARRRPTSSVRRLDRIFELPGGGHHGRACATECDDPSDRVDFKADDDETFVLCVILSQRRTTDEGELPQSSSKQALFYEVSTRRSRLAQALSAENRTQRLAAIAEDPFPSPGDVCTGFVTGASAKAGVFVRLSRKVVGRVLKKDLSDGYVEDPLREFFLGRLVAPVVTSPVSADGKVDLSLRPSDIKQEGKTKVEVVAGAKLKGRVTRVEDYGVFVKLDDAPFGTDSGLAHISEIADEKIKDLKSRFLKGDRVKALVLKVEDNGNRKKVSLSLKPKHFEDDMDEDEEDAEEDEEEDEELVDDEQAAARVDAILARDDDDDDLLADEEDSDEDEDDDDDDEDDDEDEFLEEVDEAVTASGGLQWDDDDDEDDDDEDEEEEEEEEVEQEKTTKRQKTTMAAADVEARARETELAEGLAPETNEDFERLLVSEPNSGSLWARYLQHRAASTDAAGARRIGERALATINYRAQSERAKVWLALLRLEKDHGAPAAFAAVVDRACAANDPVEILVKVADMHAKAGDTDLCDAAYRRAEGKGPSADVYAKHARALLLAKQPEKARKVLSRALQANAPDDKAKVTLLSRFAVAEFDAGDAEKAKTDFDRLLSDNPKRIDLWKLYIAQSLKRQNVDATRAIYMRLADAPLAPKAMRSALRDFVDFEKRHGDDHAVANVRHLARAYVEESKKKRQQQIQGDDKEED